MTTRLGDMLLELRDPNLSKQREDEIVRLLNELGDRDERYRTILTPTGVVVQNLETPDGSVRIAPGEFYFGDSSDPQNSLEISFPPFQAQLGGMTMSEDGLQIPDVGDSIVLQDQSNNRYALISMRNINSSYSGLSLLVFDVDSETNQISNGDFETGDLTDWTETDPSSLISVEQTERGYSLKFAAGASSTGYVTQSHTLNYVGSIITLKVKAPDGGILYVGNTSGVQTFSLSAVDAWRSLAVVLTGSTEDIKIYAVTSYDLYVDEVVVRLSAVNQEQNLFLSPGGTLISGGVTIAGIAVFNPESISGTSRQASGFHATGGVYFSGFTDITISGTTGLDSGEDASVLRVNPTTASTVQSMQYGVLSSVGGYGIYPGKIVTIINVGSYNITIKDESTGGAADERFKLGGTDLTVGPDDVATFWYDDSDARWRLLSKNF